MHLRDLKTAGWASILILITMAFTTIPHDGLRGDARMREITSAPPGAEAEGAYVRAVLFWTPESEDCRQALEQDLPTIIRRYDPQLQILYVDINHPNGDSLFQSVIQQFKDPSADLPVMLIGRTLLQGKEIAQELEALAVGGIQKGGIDWPDIPGLETWLENLPEAMSQPLGAAGCSECELQATRAAFLRSNRAQAQLPGDSESGAGEPVVRAIMFWMDGCPHCHEVLDNVLPPIRAKYGEQFELLLVELVSEQEVMALYELAESMGLAKEELGVPLLVIGEHVLIGSGEIPARLPGLIDQYLAAGGVDYPRLPVLAPLLPTQVVEEGASAQTTPYSTPKPTGSQKSDGFSLAIAVLAGMLIALFYSGFTFIKGFQTRAEPDAQLTDALQWRDWITLGLLLAGLIVAGYLAYIETQAVPAACGPVGDCNAVQSSPYARLFGVLPIGVLGVLGYLAILAAWIVQRARPGLWSGTAALAVFGMSTFGTLFSVYLTYLELFVINAVCLWCLTSAVIMTILMLISLNPAKLSLKKG